MILGFLFSMFAVGYVTACSKQSDCEDTECCAKKAFVQGEYNCVPFRQKNDLCLFGDLNQRLFDGIYDITCPCKPGLLCQQYEYSDGKGGYITEDNPTCRDVIEDRELERQRYGSNSGSYANANSGSYSYSNSRSSAKSNSGSYANSNPNAFTYSHARRRK